MSSCIEYFNNGDYDSAIEIAARDGVLEFVSKSLKLASPYAVGQALKIAAGNGEISILSFILGNTELDAFAINFGLYKAAQNGRIEALLKIIELAGSKVDPKEYPSILDAAASNNHPQMVAKIFEIAKEELSNFDVSRAFANAGATGLLDVVTKLYEIASNKIELDAIKETLIYASRLGHTEVVLKILEVSGTAEIATVFRNAASNGQVNLIAKIIETAGNAITDDLYCKAFHDAVSNDKLEVVSKIWEIARTKISAQELNKAFSQAGDKGYYQMIPKIFEFASHKIDQKQLLETLSKSAGNPRNGEVFKTIIKLVGSKISKKEFKVVFEDLVIKGNFDAAIKLQKIIGYKNFTKKIDGIKIMVSAIINGLEKSLEPNKYQAVSQLFTKAGIEIPEVHQHKLKEVMDNKNSADFEFINGLAHKLAKYYLTSDEPTEWLKIVNGMQNLDNDFALEVVTINGLIPEPFEKDTVVYRGMHLPATDEELKLFFDYGIRSFSAGGEQKMLGYYVSKPWNDAGKSGWADGGTYVSVDPRTAAEYAVECVNYNVNQVTTCGGKMTMSESERKFIFEIQLPKGSPKIFGAEVAALEMVPSYIKGEDIVAIYEVTKAFGIPYITGIPTKVFINQNAKAEPQLKLNEIIIYDSEKVTGLYNSLNSPYGYFESNTIRKKQKLFNTQQDFYIKYSNDKYAIDQAKIKESYYSDKPSYSDLGFTDALVGECNPDYYCC